MLEDHHRDEFAEKGVTIVRDAFSEADHPTSLFDLYGWMKSNVAIAKTNGQQSPGTPIYSHVGEIEKLLINLMPVVEQATGLKLYPTYAFGRLLDKTSKLDPHHDRRACEISVTMCVGYDGGYCWPIWLEDASGEKLKVVQTAGDAVIYRGCERLHWREAPAPEMQWQAQVFFHYVDQNGPNADLLFDRLRVGRNPAEIEHISKKLAMASQNEQ